jgi:hypothetical protein
LNVSSNKYANQHLYAVITGDGFESPAQDASAQDASAPAVRDGKPTSCAIAEADIVRVSPLRISVSPARQLVVRVVDSAQQPVPNISIGSSSGGRATGVSAYGTSDKNGIAKLPLPLGEYSLVAVAPRDSKYVTTSGHTVITEEQHAPEATIEMELGCKVVVKIVDAVSGEPIAGEKFWEQGKRSVVELQRHPSYISNDCRSDENGEAVAIVRRGRREFGVGGVRLPKGYEGTGSYSGGGLVECLAGETVHVVFKVKARVK